MFQGLNSPGASDFPGGFCCPVNIWALMGFGFYPVDHKSGGNGDYKEKN